MSFAPQTAWSRLSPRRAILLAVGLVIIFAAFLFQRRQDTHLRDVRELLNANIHQGMSRTEVESFLDRQGIAHSYAAEKQETKNPDRSRAEYAIIRGNPDKFVRADYQIRFNFDSSGRLTSYSIQEHLTGP